MSSVSSEPSASVTRPTRGLPYPLVAFLITVASFIGSTILSGILIEVLLRTTGGDKFDPPQLFGSPILLQFSYMLVAYVIMFGVTVAIMGGTRYSLQAVGLLRPRLKDIGYAALAFLVYITGYIILVSVVQQLVPSLDLDQKQDIGFENLQGVYLGIVFVLLVLIVPFVEEFMMRGLLFSSLRQKLKFGGAAVITSLLFAALHLGGGEAGAGPLWIAAIDTFVLSIVLCYLRERTGRLWAGIGLHAIKNGIAFAALFIFVGNA
jgi:membrane protease YdiL (CAAX protease family)